MHLKLISSHGASSPFNSAATSRSAITILSNEAYISPIRRKMAPTMQNVHLLAKRADLGPFTPASLAMLIIGLLLAIVTAVMGVVYFRKRRQTPSAAATMTPTVKPDDSSSSAASEEYPLETLAPVNERMSRLENYNRYSMAILSRGSHVPSAKSPRMPRSPNANRYSIGMLSRISIDPSIRSPNPDRDRSRSRSRVERDRAYARLSMGGAMTRASMAPRSPRHRSPMSPRGPLQSAGIMSRLSTAEATSPIPRSASARPSPMPPQGDFLEPPPRYS